MDLDLSEFRDLFVDEGRNHLRTLNSGLLALERRPGDREVVQTVFRAAHSLKGGAATMGYDSLATLAHAVEDLLDPVRRGRWQLTPELVELAFSALDALQMLLDDVAADRGPSVDVATMQRRLLSFAPEADEVALAGFGVGSVVSPTEPAESHHGPAVEAPSPAAVVRVNVRNLDALLSTVTEMVIHRSRLDRLCKRYALAALEDALQTHDRLLTQLRDAVLEMRMVPVEHLFDRFPRMVRDLLRAQGKEGQLVVDGGAVEVDRTALESLTDPLNHLLRNAIDHGLETREERLSVGKSSEGVLRLSARRERDSVYIELADDGRGMDADLIAAVAVERGLVSHEAIAMMAPDQRLELICRPGLSLSDQVTSVSGRGVGMSVVKQQVEALRGSLEIETTKGLGSTFRLRIPAILALLDAMLVQVGGDQFAVPITQVERIVKIDPREIEYIGRQQVLALPDESVVPLWTMHMVLQIAAASDSESRYVLILSHGGRPVGLRVDAVLEREEVVARPLPAAFRGIPGLGGVTILGDGQVALILDLEGLDFVSAGE